MFRNTSALYYTLGGGDLHIYNTLLTQLIKTSSEQFLSFTEPCTTAIPRIKVFNITVSIECTGHCYQNVPYETLLSLNYSKIIKTSKGISVIKFASDTSQRPFVCINVNKDFSEFKHIYFHNELDLQKSGIIDIYRTVANSLLLQHSIINQQGLIFHAAGGRVQNKGMVFTAPSGTGKSTLSHLLLSSSGNKLFSEERIIIRSVGDGWHLWGTPWCGTGSIALNDSSPLSALVFLSQAEQTSIKPLAPSAALHRLLKVVSIPWYSEEWTNKGLAICEELIREIPMYELSFTPDQSAVSAVEELAGAIQ